MLNIPHLESSFVCRCRSASQRSSRWCAGVQMVWSVQVCLILLWVKTTRFVETCWAGDVFPPQRIHLQFDTGTRFQFGRKCSLVVLHQMWGKRTSIDRTLCWLTPMLSIDFLKNTKVLDGEPWAHQKHAVPFNTRLPVESSWTVWKAIS